MTIQVKEIFKIYIDGKHVDSSINITLIQFRNEICDIQFVVPFVKMNDSSYKIIESWKKYEPNAELLLDFKSIHKLIIKGNGNETIFSGFAKLVVYNISCHADCFPVITLSFAKQEN